MPIKRFPENPLVTPRDVPPTHEDFDVVCVFNPGVVKFGDETLLLMRVAERPKNANPSVILAPYIDFDSNTPLMSVREFKRDDPKIDCSDPRMVRTENELFLTSISHLRLARSKDGRRFAIDQKPALIPDRPSEAFGIEDPRITEIDGVYYIVYKSVAPTGISQSLATTRDFVTFEKHGVILPPENMDAMIFPRKIGGRFAVLHRPFPNMIGDPNIWLAYSDDAHYWGDHKFIAGAQRDGWEGGRIGGGLVPILTDRGWLEIYHGATKGHCYSLGAMLLDHERPEKIIARCPQPIMEPEAPYEMSGFVPEVVFSCGGIVDGDRLTIYYGAADTVIAGAELSISEILEMMPDAEFLNEESMKAKENKS